MTARHDDAPVETEARRFTPPQVTTPTPPALADVDEGEPLTFDERLAERYRAGLDPRRLLLAERLAAAVEDRRRCLAGRDKSFLRHRVGARSRRELEDACTDAFELGEVRFGSCLHAGRYHVFIAPPLREAKP